MHSIPKRRGIWLAAVFIILIFMLAGANDAMAGKYKRKSKEHEEACKSWCRSHPDLCDHCGKKVNCGKGFETVKSWTGYGKNWYACKKRLSRDELRSAKYRECMAWCGRNPDCDVCTSHRCPYGKRTMKKWGGRGENFRACGKKQYRSTASKRNQQDCLRWCEEHRGLCQNCSTNKNCGQYREAIKSWKGKGRNFHACAERRTIKEKNKADCEAYCEEHPGECVECKTNKGCGPGLTAMESFRLGTNAVLDYHACKRKPSRSGTFRSNAD